MNFLSEIIKIHENLSNATHENLSFSEPRTDHCLSVFDLVTKESLSKIICRSPIKSCTLDPIPAKLLKCILPTLLPVIVKIVNLSLMSGVMPECFKMEMVLDTQEATSGYADTEQLQASIKPAISIKSCGMCSGCSTDGVP